MNVRKFTKSAWVRLPGLLIACLMLAGLLLAQAPANPVSAVTTTVVTRNLPTTVEPGETFVVTVTFTSDAADFNAILLTDLAPTGWDVSVDTTWCTPNANAALATDNKAEITWNGPYSIGTSFTAVYKVTVPGAATPGTYTFPNSGQHFLRYFVGEPGPYYIYDFAGDDSVEILSVPDISVNPTSNDFGSVNVGSSSAAQTFTVSNNGTGNLTVGTITKTGYGASHFAIQNDLVSGQTIASNSSLALEVVFRPTSTGSKTASLSIPSNDPNENPLNVPLQGTGVAAACNNGSANVAFIPNTHGPGGGYLPTAHSAFSAFTFTNVPYASVNDTTLASYDTVVLITCDPMTDLTASQRTALINWVSNGGKLIIYDSECLSNDTIDNSWLPYPYTTFCPGAIGASKGPSYPYVDLWILENNTLSSSDSGSPYYINTTMVAEDTDAAGDQNVFIVQSAGWCGDMMGTNAVDSAYSAPPGTTGYSHAYAHYGSGLFIYNGLDIDDITDSDPTAATGEGYLAKIWLLELQQPWGDTCGLPCGAAIIPLACDFEGSPRTGYAPLNVQFTDLTTGTADTWQWNWDFGDGATSTAQNPTHTYIAAGIYTVSLEVTSSMDTSLEESCTETKVAYITVRALPTEEEEPPNLVAAYLLVSPEQVQPNQQVEISINIGNDGGTAGTRSIALYINGHMEDSQTVSVSPGSAKNVVFTVTRTEPGTYQVLLEGNEGQFTVLGTAGGHWAGPLGTGGIIAIVVFVIALVLALVFVLRRE